MPYTFQSPAYNFPSKWTTEQRATAQFIIKTGIQVGAKASDMQKMMSKSGISYRKTNMLSDISRAKAVEQSKSGAAYKRAETWFNTLEKIRGQTEGKTRAEALTFMQIWKNESWESEQQALMANQLEMEGLCPSPPC